MSSTVLAKPVTGLWKQRPWPKVAAVQPGVSSQRGAERPAARIDSGPPQDCTAGFDGDRQRQAGAESCRLGRPW